MELKYYGFAFFIFVLICLLMVLYNFLFSDLKRQRKLLDEKENKLLRFYQSVEEALDDFNDSVEKSFSEMDSRLKELGDLHAETERFMREISVRMPDKLPQQSPAAQPPGARPRTVRGAPPVSEYVPQPPLRQPMPSLRPQAAPQQVPAQTVQAAPPQQPPVLRETPKPQHIDVKAEDVKDEPADFQPAGFRRAFETASALSDSELTPQEGANRNEQILSMAEKGMDRSAIAKELGITLSEVDLVIGMGRA